MASYLEKVGLVLIRLYWTHILIRFSYFTPES